VGRERFEPNIAWRNLPQLPFFFCIFLILKVLLLNPGYGISDALSMVSCVTNVSKIMPKEAQRIVSRDGCLLWQHKTWNHSLCVRVCALSLKSGKKWEKKPVSALFRFGTVLCVPYTIHTMQRLDTFFHYWILSSIPCRRSFS
jgi:hypothetical protein